MAVVGNPRPTPLPVLLRVRTTVVSGRASAIDRAPPESNREYLTSFAAGATGVLLLRTLAVAGAQCAEIVIGTLNDAVSPLPSVALTLST